MHADTKAPWIWISASQGPYDDRAMREQVSWRSGGKQWLSGQQLIGLVLHSMQKLVAAHTGHRTATLILSVVDSRLGSSDYTDGRVALSDMEDYQWRPASCTTWHC